MENPMPSARKEPSWYNITVMAVMAVIGVVASVFVGISIRKRGQAKPNREANKDFAVNRVLPKIQKEINNYDDKSIEVIFSVADIPEGANKPNSYSGVTYIVSNSNDMLKQVA